MHTIEPFYSWTKYYNVAEDQKSPYFGKTYNLERYSDTIYGYYIDPAWDYMGSETLYIKILFADYKHQLVIIEFIGEWNDAITNDIMHLKRNIIDHFYKKGINKYILIGEHVLNFHGSDDCYYEEWFDDVEDGWIAMVNFRDFVLQEMQHYNLDSYLNFGGTLQIGNWRTYNPAQLASIVNDMITRRISC